MATPPLGVVEIPDPSSFSEPVPTGGDGDVRWYAFSLSESKSMVIDTQLSPPGTDTQLYLYDGTGEIVASDDEGGGDSTSKIEQTLAAGTYYICAGMYQITAEPDCVASSDTPIAAGYHLRTHYGTPPPPDEVLEWYARGADFLGWNEVEPSGSQTGWSPVETICGKVENPTAGAVVWTHEWMPVEGTESEPTFTYPKGPDPSDIGGGDVNWPNGIQVDPFPLVGAGHGELRLHCAIDGVPVAGYLWAVFSPGEPGSYSTMAWGYEDGGPSGSAFWTDFKNTFEVV